MLNFISFGSGSSGNCYYLIADGYGLLIDLGIGIRAFRRHLGNYGLPVAQIQALLLTHDHTDHVKAAAPFAGTFKIPVYASAKVHEAMLKNSFLTKKVPPELRRELPELTPRPFGPFTVTSFPVPHDSAENFGYVIEYQKVNFVLLTDVGHFTDPMAPLVSRATHLVIEANYDPQLLESGPYPRPLKRRICSGFGHSSNIQTACFLAENLRPGHTRRVWLCHLSEENNNPTLAFTTVAEALKGAGHLVNAAPSELQHARLPLFGPTSEKESSAADIDSQAETKFPIRLDVLPRRTPIALTSLE